MILNKLTSQIERLSFYIPFTRYFFEKYYKEVVTKEVALASIKKEDKVLFIGGGSVPATAYEIHRQTKASVDVIDIDKKAVKLAKELTNKLGYSDINILHGDGTKIDASSYTVVHIALQANPQYKILENIASNSFESTRILIRCPKDSLRYFYKKGFNSNCTKNNKKSKELKIEAICGCSKEFAYQENITMNRTLLFKGLIAH